MCIEAKATIAAICVHVDDVHGDTVVTAAGRQVIIAFKGFSMFGH